MLNSFTLCHKKKTNILSVVRSTSSLACIYKSNVHKTIMNVQIVVHGGTWWGLVLVVHNTILSWTVNCIFCGLVRKVLLCHYGNLYSILAMLRQWRSPYATT